ncbi:MAG: glutamine--fructose-6-phosphate transaminase (isomerizing), partial [Proteobacteria bacterium]|nr:glutamine--fructose-6-phosphate transaminase (isomerizing) [Pseudomonadota bacterium]
PTLAVQKMIKRLEGAFALGIMIKKYPNYLFAARCGSPLVLGISSDDLYIGSDALALSAWTNKVCYLKEGDMAVLKKDGQAFSYTVYDSNNNEVQRPIQQSNINMSTITKGTFDHYMLKEIYEQPKSILETLENLLYIKTLEPKGDLATIDWNTIKNIVLIACGTSYYACLVAKYWFEKISKIKVDVDIASEFRYRSPVLNSYDLAIVVSQSGETIDTLSALKMLKNSGCLVSAIVNVDESSIAREADFVFLTQAGPEIGVASTKAFTSQLITFMVLVLESAFKKGNITNDYYKQNIENISHLPKKTLDVLKLNEKIQILSNSLTSVNSALFLGRGTNYPIALEGALKLKEISYIHAEGYPAGELKHGPIALIDKSMPVIVIAPHDEWFEKTSSNVQEVIARGANVIFITDYVGEELMRKQGITNIPYVTINFESDVFTNSIFYSIIVQLLAYYTAYYKGTDVDQPRNLAKSVTVE